MLGCLFRSRFVRVLAVPLLLLAAGFAYLGVLQLTGNFHEVVPGEFYRSAQLNESRVARAAKQHHIASIVNLRGENVGRAWYDEEILAAERHHIAHFDFRMSAKSPLDAQQTAQLVKLMKDAPKPLLIHCQAGADRSGLAAALYLAAKDNSTIDVAEDQLSPVYGHISWPVIGRPQMDLTFEKMAPVLHMQQWAMNGKTEYR